MGRNEFERLVMEPGIYGVDFIPGKLYFKPANP
jgi:hypothetical protein